MICNSLYGSNGGGSSDCTVLLSTQTSSDIALAATSVSSTFYGALFALKQSVKLADIHELQLTIACPGLYSKSSSGSCITPYLYSSSASSKVSLHAIPLLAGCTASFDSIFKRTSDSTSSFLKGVYTTTAMYRSGTPNEEAYDYDNCRLTNFTKEATITSYSYDYLYFQSSISGSVNIYFGKYTNIYLLMK